MMHGPASGSAVLRPEADDFRLSQFPGASEPIGALLAGLQRENVRYCHWKSNIRLAASLSGQEDLDLFVDRRHATRFYALLTESGFRLARSRGGTGHPGTLHAFALDKRTLRLVHVHAYFQILTGDSLAKTYLIPLRDALLSGEQRLWGVRVPAPEVELVLFVIRIALKHTALSEIVLVNREYGEVVKELNWLRGRVDEAAAASLWHANLPGPEDDLFGRLLLAIGDPDALMTRIHLGRWLARRLRCWRRFGRPATFASRLSRLWALAWARVRRRRLLVLHDGGAIVAFVGPKASGKSTLGNAVAERLGRDIDVQRVHVGKPPSTLISAPVNVLLPLLRRVLVRERSSEYENPRRRAQQQFSFVFVLRMLLLAHDRRALLLRCRRQAGAGTIVIADRYPSDGPGSLDGNRFNADAIAGCGSALKRRLMCLEHALYRGLPRPDLAIRLSAPIETTLVRDARRIKREGPDPAALRRRRELETDLCLGGSPVIDLDTDRALEETIADVVQQVWIGI